MHLDKLKDEENFFSSFGIAIRSVYSGAGDIVGGVNPSFCSRAFAPAYLDLEARLLFVILNNY